jgi:rubrerythrin
LSKSASVCCFFGPADLQLAAQRKKRSPTPEPLADVSASPVDEEDHMSATIDDLLSAFTDELQKTSRRYASLVDQAEAAGHPQLARLFRAVVASEAARSKLMHKGLAHHAADVLDVFVCPKCGLVFLETAPEKCPVDYVASAQFERIP